MEPGRKLAKLSKDSSATLREKGTGGDQSCILEVTLWEAQLCPGSLTPPRLAGKGGFRQRSGRLQRLGGNHRPYREERGQGWAGTPSHRARDFRALEPHVRVKNSLRTCQL